MKLSQWSGLFLTLFLEVYHAGFSFLLGAALLFVFVYPPASHFVRGTEIHRA
jgi:hypothetical protein